MEYFRRIKKRYSYSAILLRQLVITDFKLRYQGSILGYIWSLLRPLLLFLIMYVVFVKFLKVGNSVPHYPVYLLLGVVLWNFFGEITTGSIGAIVGKGDLLRKINFPRYIIVLSGSIAALINLLLNTVVILIFILFSHISFHWGMLLAIPLVIELYVFSLGVAFFLSALFVRFRDVTYVWEVFMQGAFYATPIFYSLASIPLKARYIIVLNPVAQVMQEIRRVLVSNKTLTIGQVYASHSWVTLTPFLLTASLGFISMAYFRKRSRYFAEEV